MEMYSIILRKFQKQRCPKEIQREELNVKEIQRYDVSFQKYHL